MFSALAKFLPPTVAGLLFLSRQASIKQQLQEHVRHITPTQSDAHNNTRKINARLKALHRSAQQRKARANASTDSKAQQHSSQYSKAE